MIDLADCAGCEDDFYNGNNPYGVKECWNRRNGKYGKYRLISIEVSPPYLHIPVRDIPICYRGKRYVKVSPEALDNKGFWKR